MGGDVDGWAARIHLRAHQESTEARREPNGILSKGAIVTLRHSPQGNRVAAWTGEANGGRMGNGGQKPVEVAAQRLQEPAVACSCEETRRKMGKRLHSMPGMNQAKHESSLGTPTQRHA